MIIGKFKAPFGVIPALRLQHVPRWAIINTTKEQSVAEHSFGVAVIVKKFCYELGYDTQFSDMLVRQAIFHDIDEVYTGDIPSPAKVEKGSEPKEVLVELADLVEAHRFIRSHAIENPDTIEWLLSGLRKNIDKCIEIMNVDDDFVSYVNLLMYGE